MRKFSLPVALAAVIVADAAVVPASADETGMASIHSWVKVGKKTCLDGHFHNGNGSGANKKAAEAAAVSSWAGFTSLEYGSSWGDIRIAAQKKMGCSASAPSYWSCNLEAIPCRPY